MDKKEWWILILGVLLVLSVAYLIMIKSGRDIQLSPRYVSEDSLGEGGVDIVKHGAHGDKCKSDADCLNYHKCINGICIANSTEFPPAEREISLD